MSLEGLANAAASATPVVAAKAPPAPTVATKGGRGTGYSRTEDLLIAKAFMAALEDPIHGNAMKGMAFMSKMHAAYKILLVEQEKLLNSPPCLAAMLP